jgi:hypothetical protein
MDRACKFLYSFVDMRPIKVDDGKFLNDATSSHVNYLENGCGLFWPQGAGY